MMRNAKYGVTVLCLVMLSGCSIAGNWKTVRIEPAEMGDQFAFSSVDFGSDGNYSAVVKYDGKSRNMSGKYEWNGCCLKIMPREGETREYRGELWWGKTLKLHHKSDGKSMTGVMERQAE